MTVVVEQGRRGGDRRGNVQDRASRRRWLVQEYRADVDLMVPRVADSEFNTVPLGQGEPACRCYRCGRLLTEDTVTPDRIVPGCQGGTYRRWLRVAGKRVGTNIRPACSPCQSQDGGARRGKPGNVNGRRA